MTITIKNRFNSEIMHVVEAASLKDAVIRLINSGANLRRANLSGANLRGANLRDTDLRDANLRDADLSDANLRGADLRGADLRDANLRDADLSDADLSDANLRGAGLYGAIGIMSAYIPGMSSRGDYLITNVHDDGLRFYAGCWSGTLEEFQKRAAGRDLYLWQAAVFERVYQASLDK